MTSTPTFHEINNELIRNVEEYRKIKKDILSTINQHTNLKVEIACLRLIIIFIVYLYLTNKLYHYYN